MTFLEAAIEVLKREGKPLPARRLAELSVKMNLLSVVGRDPEGTMVSRLEDAIAKDGHRIPLFRVKPGVYGLTSYPARDEEPEEPAASEAAEASEGEPAANGKKKRRRRGRRGKGKAGEATKAAEAETEETGTDAGAGTGVDADEGTGAGSEEPVAAAEGQPAERRGRRRSRRGGRGRRKGERTAPPEPVATDEHEAEPEPVPSSASASPPGPGAEPVPGFSPAAEDDELLGLPEAEPAGGDFPAEVPSDEELDEEFDLPGGPVLAPALGAEDVTRTDDEREVREEILGSRASGRRDRRRRRGRERDQRRDPRAERRGPREADKERPAERHERHERHERPQAAERPAEAAPARARTLLDAALDLLRGEGGRPMHVRHFADLLVKRKAPEARGGGPNDVARQLRLELVAELRAREVAGLRARVRSLGGGQWSAGERKLDPELSALERELAERAARLARTTLSVVRRRLSRLAPPAFEALARLAAEALGVESLELVRRGEGVAYFGGTRMIGAARQRTLVAFRPGEAEINRRAVGELRAGLTAKGFDQGILFSPARLAEDGATELKAGAHVFVYDGAALAAVCAEHGIGLRRLYLPVDYLDLDFFAELNE